MDREFQEYRIKTGAQIAALEYLLVHMSGLITMTMTDAQFEKMRQNWAAQLESLTVPGLAAPLSDLHTAELRDEMLRILSGVAAARQAFRAPD